MQTLVPGSFQRIGMWVSQIEAGDLDTNGYATISNTGSLGAFTGATVPALASATYDLDITVDSTLRQTATALLNTDDWDGIAAKIQAALRALTSSTETVAISGGKIVVTSATEGATSTIVIAAGTAGSGGGDLLAAIDALGATYTTSLDTPVDGTEGTISITIDSSASTTNTTDAFAYQLDARGSTGIHKTGLVSSYSTSTGILTISDNAATTELATDDIITVVGHFYR